MPDKKDDDEKPATKKSSKTLLRAGESSDAAVHTLLANRAALTMNPEANENAEAKIKAIDDELEEMGYTAK